MNCIKRQGIGSAMLNYIIDELTKEALSSFWCDARESAMQFYMRFGFVSEGDRFYKSDLAYNKLVLKLASFSP